LSDFLNGRRGRGVEKSIWDAAALLARIDDFSTPIRTFECDVPVDWIDFNGHLNEARYLECFSYGSDALMQLIGCDQAYIKSGKSYFTVETHIQHLGEVGLGEPIFVETQILQAEGKKLHVYHFLFHDQGDGQDPDLLATGEQMLLHVDLATRKTSMPEPELLEKMRHYGDLHKALPVPDGVGRGIGQHR